MKSPEIPNSKKFEKTFTEDGKTVYLFQNVFVVVGERNGFVSLSFGTFDKEPDYEDFNQPSLPIAGVDMRYISECMRQVLEFEGANEFWFYPHETDTSGDTEKRGDTRLRLFKKHFNVRDAEDGLGYIGSFTHKLS